MTIGVVTTSFPRHAGDFAGGFVEDDVRMRARGGDVIEVIAADGPGPGPAPGPGSAGANAGPVDLPTNVRVLRVASGAPIAAASTATLFYGAGAPETLERGGAAAWAQALFFWAGLCERIRARAMHWDRIVAHWLVPCGLAAQSVAPHLPVTAYVHSGDVALLERIPGGASLARRLVCGNLDDLVFASANLQRRFACLVDAPSRRLVLPGRGRRARGLIGRVAPPVPSADQVSRFEPVPGARLAARAALGVDAPIILAVGRLIPIKGFDVLLRAAVMNAVASAPAAPAPRTTAAEVVILGEGPERPHLERLAARLRVRLRLPGLVSRDVVRQWLWAADLYVQPSRALSTGRTEGLPVSTIEALAAGLPVVASSTGGLAELRGHRGVRLVLADDVAALAAALHADAR